MSASVNFDNAVAFQDYLRKYMPMLIGMLFTGFPSAQVVTPHEGIKDQLVLTEDIIGDLVQNWSKTFDPLDDAISFNPRTLHVYPMKVDLQLYPQEWESNYLGEARKPGFKVDDLPYEAYIMSRIIEKVKSQHEISLFQAERIASPTAGTPMSGLFDGLLHLVADKLAESVSSFTAVTTASHTTSNAVANAEAVHAALAPQYQAEETYMFCSLAFARLYVANYRADYGKYIEKTKVGTLEMIPLDFGNCKLVPTIGMGTSSRLIVTPKSNIHIGYDMADDASSIRVQQIHRSMDLMMDFKFGCQFGIMHNDILRVNNLT